MANKEKGACSCGCCCSRVKCVVALVVLLVAIAVGGKFYIDCAVKRVVGGAAGTTGAVTAENLPATLLQNPKMVLDALMAYDRQQKEEAMARKSENVKAAHNELYKDKSDPILGDPNGKKVMVEFFDYNCGYCRMMSKNIEQLIKEVPGLKVVMKELPSMRPSSSIGSLAALAAGKQGKFAEMHKGLMNLQGEPTEAIVSKLAKDLKLDIKKFDADRSGKELADKLDSNRTLAQKIGVESFPTLVFGDKITAGAMSVEQAKQELGVK
ncbi:hypothetical protein FACS1894186_0300 [Alphaproteobacteria bacterium]|nr:hypothetical protein FACS1894186_0300 [Alphaproteobacteria bacterium]